MSTSNRAYQGSANRAYEGSANRAFGYPNTGVADLSFNSLKLKSLSMTIEQWTQDPLFIDPDTLMNTTTFSALTRCRSGLANWIDWFFEAHDSAPSLYLIGVDSGAADVADEYGSAAWSDTAFPGSIPASYALKSMTLASLTASGNDVTAVYSLDGSVIFDPFTYPNSNTSATPPSQFALTFVDYSPTLGTTYGVVGVIGGGSLTANIDPQYWNIDVTMVMEIVQ